MNESAFVLFLSPGCFSHGHGHDSCVLAVAWERRYLDDWVAAVGLIFLFGQLSECGGCGCGGMESRGCVNKGSLRARRKCEWMDGSKEGGG